MFPTKPIGFLLHGTRSGAPHYDIDQEYAGTLNYVRAGASGLGWQATIGNDAVALHLPWTHWAWHAYDASRILIGLEFAQATVEGAITDAQIRAAAWCIAQAYAATRERWGTPIPVAFWTHAEVEANGWTHHTPEGKTDTFPMSDPRAVALKSRLLARLRQLGVPG